MLESVPRILIQTNLQLAALQQSRARANSATNCQNSRSNSLGQAKMKCTILLEPAGFRIFDQRARSISPDSGPHVDDTK